MLGVSTFFICFLNACFLAAARVEHFKKNGFIRGARIYKALRLREAVCLVRAVAIRLRTDTELITASERVARASNAERRGTLHYRASGGILALI